MVVESSNQSKQGVETESGACRTKGIRKLIVGLLLICCIFSCGFSAVSYISADQKGLNASESTVKEQVESYIKSKGLVIKNDYVEDLDLISFDNGLPAGIKNIVYGQFQSGSDFADAQNTLAFEQYNSCSYKLIEKDGNIYYAILCF